MVPLLPTAVVATAATSAAAEASVLLEACASPAGTVGGALGLTLLRRAGDGTRNVLGGIVDVEVLVNVSWDRRNLGTKFLLNLVQVETVFPVDQVDGQTKMTKPTGTANSVEICLGVLGKVKVDNDVDSLNIDTAGQKIRAHQVAAVAGAEVVEDTITSVLKHACMRIEARVSKLSDLLGEEFDTGGGVAEDDGLVDLETGEERVQAVNLLLLLNECVVLSDTAEGQLVHQVDLVRVVHVLVHKLFDNDGESCTEEHNLAIFGVEGEQLVDCGREFGGQELIRFVHDKSLCCGEVGNAFAGKVEDSAGGTDKDVDSFVQSDNVVSESGTTGGDHNVEAEMLA